MEIVLLEEKLITEQSYNRIVYFAIIVSRNTGLETYNYLVNSFHEQIFDCVLNSIQSQIELGGVNENNFPENFDDLVKFKISKLIKFLTQRPEISDMSNTLSQIIKIVYHKPHANKPYETVTQCLESLEFRIIDQFEPNLQIPWLGSLNPNYKLGLSEYYISHTGKVRLTQKVNQDYLPEFKVR